MSDKKVPQEEQNRLIWKVYNKRDGLCSSKDELEFLERAGQIDAFATEHLGKEGWDDLRVKIWKHVVVPRIVCPQIPVCWKNNCCESLVRYIHLVVMQFHEKVFFNNKYFLFTYRITP